MNLSEFQTGTSYVARKTDFEPPDGSPVIAGKTLRFEVLTPADASNRTVFDGEVESVPPAATVESWKAFLRVRNLDSGKVHLLHPETLAGANRIN